MADPKDVEGESLPKGTKVALTGTVVNNIGEGTVCIRPTGVDDVDPSWFVSVPGKCVKKLPLEQQYPPFHEGSTL